MIHITLQVLRSSYVFRFSHLFQILVLTISCSTLPCLGPASCTDSRPGWTTRTLRRRRALPNPSASIPSKEAALRYKDQSRTQRQKCVQNQKRDISSSAKWVETGNFCALCEDKLNFEIYQTCLFQSLFIQLDRRFLTSRLWATELVEHVPRYCWKKCFFITVFQMLRFILKHFVVVSPTFVSFCQGKIPQVHQSRKHLERSPDWWPYPSDSNRCSCGFQSHANIFQTPTSAPTVFEINYPWQHHLCKFVSSGTNLPRHKGPEQK